MRNYLQILIKKGIDCSLLSCIFFLSQAIIAAFMSFVTAKFNKSAIVLISALFSILNCFWIALFVIFPEESETVIEKKTENCRKSFEDTLL